MFDNLQCFNGCTHRLTNVTFEGNTADQGGGIRMSTPDGVLRNVTFRDNNASSAGGGMFISEAFDLKLTNVAFYGNSSGGIGGGILNAQGSESNPLLLTNVTLSGNTAESTGGGIVNTGFIVLSNTILWGNAAGNGGNEIFNRTTGTAELEYSLYSDGPGDIVEGSGFEVDDNSLTVDPLFRDQEEGNLRLEEDSPAIDAGDPDTDLALFPVNDDGDPVDVGNNPRVFGAEIDMGAWEWNPNVADEAGPEALTEALGLPHPNPVRGLTTLALQVTEPQHVTVEVFDALGRRVQTLYDGALPAGAAETLTLDAFVLPAGVYIVRATGEDFAATRRVTVVK